MRAVEKQRNPLPRKGRYLHAEADEDQHLKKTDPHGGEHKTLTSTKFSEVPKRFSSVTAHKEKRDPSHSRIHELQTTTSAADPPASPDHLHHQKSDDLCLGRTLLLSEVDVGRNPPVHIDPIKRSTSTMKKKERFGVIIAVLSLKRNSP